MTILMTQSDDLFSSHILQSYIILILDRLEEKEIIVDGCHGEDMHQ